MPDYTYSLKYITYQTIGTTICRKKALQRMCYDFENSNRMSKYQFSFRLVIREETRSDPDDTNKRLSRETQRLRLYLGYCFFTCIFVLMG